MTEEDKRHKMIHKMAPSEWDRRGAVLATEIREWLQAALGVERCDSGLGPDGGDLWPVIDGVEYLISVGLSDKAKAMSVTYPLDTHEEEIGHKLAVAIAENELKSLADALDAMLPGSPEIAARARSIRTNMLVRARREDWL
jgi:hypothetical protein